MLLLALLACQDKTRSDTGDTAASDSTHSGDSVDTTPAPEWDAAAAPVDCSAGGEAALLEAALADADLDRDAFGYSTSDWSAWRTYVNDVFNLSWYTDVHHHPEQAACFARQVQVDLDAAALAPHPVAALLTAYAPTVDAPLSLAPADARGLALPDALSRLVEAAGGGDDPSLGETLDPALAEALTPIVLAIADAIDARHVLDASADGHHNPPKMFKGAPAMVLPGGTTTIPDVRDTDDLDWFPGWYLDPAGPRALVDHARRIAYAVEDADLTRFAGQDLSWTFGSNAGAIRISGPGDDTHGVEEGAMVLHLELGGNDIYTGSAGANVDEDNPVAVLVDLRGDDAYGYAVVADAHDTPATLPSDDDGRASAGGYYVSTSDTARQGAGRYGIGLLYDLGGSADGYTSLRMSQGFGALGVGVLADDGGDDVYAGEAGVQGAGVFGLGVLFDGGGADSYRAWAYSQGFAYVGSGGLAYDAAGDDTWWSDPGNDYGGTTLYYSPQLAAGQGNSSLSQGAGFGFRGDAYGVWWSGGFATLRDAAGNDTYTAGVFAQATGYWLGTGLLADGAGNDSYDALWYIQGGAAHFAEAIFVDGGGDDQYNPTFTPFNVSLGSGHDFSVGIAIDEGGDDTYHSTTLAMGASNCQGIGVFVDNDGADTYQADSTYGYGLGNQSTECNEATGRTAWASIGIFLDSGGDVDTYLWPEDTLRSPTNDATFGLSWTGTADEHGGAVDGDGETNFP